MSRWRPCKKRFQRPLPEACQDGHCACGVHPGRTHRPYCAYDPAETRPQCITYWNTSGCTMIAGHPGNHFCCDCNGRHPYPGQALST